MALVYFFSNPLSFVNLPLFPDVDASGDLSKAEVLRQLQAKTGVFADASACQVLSEERWKELDWDGDGTIAFREFIWAFQGWISQDDEE